MTLLQFRNADARLAYLATVYHLGRPGSETSSETLQRHDLGLRQVHDAMLPRLGDAVVEVDLSAFQVVKLDEALGGATNELKQISIAHGQSMVPGFTEAIGWLFPELREDPSAAMDLVGDAVMLRRRMGPAVDDARQAIAAAVEAAQSAKRAERPWWKLWGRGAP